MEKFAIYCKSYRNDLERVKILCQSVQKYNLDNIPFYVSCPKQDYELFKNHLPNNINVILDEDIVKKQYDQNWKVQQIIKSQFWKYIQVKNYLCIDSDSYFIRPFTYSDFMFDDETPYTVIHQQKNLFQWTARYNRELGFNPQNSFNECREKIGSIFNRKNKINYDFGPSPLIWSTKVWQSLEENYLNPNNLTFDQLIEFEPSEITWYGESLLAFKAIDLHPIEPLFMVFHYKLQYDQFLQQGYTESDIASCYMGLIMTSNWGAPLKY